MCMPTTVFPVPGGPEITTSLGGYASFRRPFSSSQIIRLTSTWSSSITAFSWRDSARLRASIPIWPRT